MFPSRGEGNLRMPGALTWAWTHVRRYPALYAIAAAWLLMISIVPSVVPRSTTSAGAISDTTGTGDLGAVQTSHGTVARSTTAKGGGGVVASGTNTTGAAVGSQPLAPVPP